MGADSERRESARSVMSQQPNPCDRTVHLLTFPDPWPQTEAEKMNDTRPTFVVPSIE